ncbi:piggyBac transposable element-derived protein 4-like protein [Lates japonicus]|uniref:PiggyBac transposable element-derived protein 4-like protein n=1 Tax=Lates japonicus TaxID=270547 RepID=A0AAD3RHA5_LATJO|nr:piggyBac transposable element-derived protein 4-like protein [Lates japonicus]
MQRYQPAGTPCLAITCYAISHIADLRSSFVSFLTDEIIQADHQRPKIILDYNHCQGAVDNLEKPVGAYSCRRMTCRWPMAPFLDVSAANLEPGQGLQEEALPTGAEHEPCEPTDGPQRALTPHTKRSHDGSGDPNQSPTPSCSHTQKKVPSLLWW